MMKYLTCSIFMLLAVGLPVIVAAQPGRDIEQIFSASLVEVPRGAPRLRGSIYVPAYSSVLLSHGNARVDFSVTLSIHNASEEHPLVLKRIGYFDTSGKTVEAFLDRAIALRPLATIQIFISTADLRGGTGANFVVGWEAPDQVPEPAVETLMIGSLGAGHYAFVSQGRPVRNTGANSTSGNAD